MQSPFSLVDDEKGFDRADTKSESSHRSLSTHTLVAEKHRLHYEILMLQRILPATGIAMCSANAHIGLPLYKAYWSTTVPNTDVHQSLCDLRMPYFWVRTLE